VIKEQGAPVPGFVDDIPVYIEGEKSENASRLSSILKRCCEWAKSRSPKIDLGPKLRFIHFTETKKEKKERKKKIQKRIMMKEKNICYCKTTKEKMAKTK
jgi:hypothetical protein